MNPIEVRFDNKHITKHGGFEVLNQFIDNRLSLFGLIQDHVHIEKRDSIYSSEKLTYALINSNLLYPFRISQLDHLKRDDYLRDKFDFPTHPDSETYRRHLHKFNRKNVVEIKRMMCRMLNSEAVLDQLDKLEKITLDIDLSLTRVFGNQEGGGYTYHKDGRKYLGIQFGFINELNFLLNLQLRSGNRYSSVGSIHLIKQMLSMIPRRFHHKIVIRADSGYFKEELLEFLEKNNIQYIIKAKSYGSFDELLRTLDHRRFRRKSDSLQIAQGHFKLNSWKKARRFLVLKRKVKVDDPKKLEDKSQLELPLNITDYYYKYSFIAVCENSLTMVKLFQYYCGRGTAENYIKEFKNGFGGAHVTTDDLVVNYANMLLKTVSYNIFSLFKKLVLIDKYSCSTITSVRYFLLYIPGKLIKRGRKYYLSLIRDYKIISAYQDWLQRSAVVA